MERSSTSRTVMQRRKLHRVVFVAAGIYNLAWGTYSVIRPQWFFRFAGLEEALHPEIFACLGMVVGLYGVLYLEVARRPEAGRLIAVVGLAGKVLGPIGALGLVASGQWPPKALFLCVTNDFVWWLPFALYLWDSRAGGPASRSGC